MSIDWITVAAQLVNFLILIWLLKRFLYRPILDGIAAREAEIANRMKAANAAQTAAQATDARLHQEHAALRNERGSLMEQTRAEAEAERERLREELRQTLAAEKADARAQLAEERARFVDDLRETGAESLISLTRKVLHDLGDTELEERIVTSFDQRLAEMADDLRAAGGQAEAAVVITHHPLSDKARARLEQRLHDTLGDFPLRFETDETQSPGLTLRLGGAQLGWTVDSYLDGLDAMLASRLASRTHLRKALP